MGCRTRVAVGEQCRKAIRVRLLQPWGPIGNSAWDPSDWISGSGTGAASWISTWWSWYSTMAGWSWDNSTSPLSNESEVYDTMYHLMELVFLANDFAVNMDIVGTSRSLGVGDGAVQVADCVYCIVPTWLMTSEVGV